jgi:hypothetical protein
MHLRASPPAPPIEAPIAIWGRERKWAHTGAQIEAPTTPCRPLRQGRQSGAPAPRDTSENERGLHLAARRTDFPPPTHARVDSHPL